ncbi:hypothetical protein OG742_37275 [Streptomyces sp. NBC_00828]|uniref:hypothetical protein n=1 Tax=Streptomyces sp. NBC_00828 TaxID=2903678 RepID=UPI003869DB1C
MTRDRRRKEDIRAARAKSGTRYTRARREAASAPGASIRTYRGECYICSACGQPAYNSVNGPAHFTEQEGGVFCPSYPAASGLLKMAWDSSEAPVTVRAEYPWPSTSAKPQCAARHHHDRFRDFTGRVTVCASCGQPAYVSELGPAHFLDQWDGIFCPRFPLAGHLVTVNWHPRSLADWKAGYVCTYPHW